MKPPRPYRLILAHLLSGISAFAVFVLWMCAASTWISPGHFKWLGLMGLGYPLALLGVVLALLFTLLFAPRRAWIALLGLVSTWGFTMDYAPLRLFPPIVPTADTTALRVMSYNTENFGNNDHQRRTALLDYVGAWHTDIFCFQEGSPDEHIMKRVEEQLAHSGLRHLRSLRGMGACLGIASRFPIVRHEEVSRSEGNAIGAFWLCPTPGDTLLVLSCHLRSNSLSGHERNTYHQLLQGRNQKSKKRSAQVSLRLMRKIAQSSVERARMTNEAVAFLARHPKLPTIVCGDMNETAISYSHHRFTSGAQLTDVYRAAGSGIGRSFAKDGIYVRIDHGFCSDHFQPLRAHIDQQVHFSDHYPLLMTLRRK